MSMTLLPHLFDSVTLFVTQHRLAAPIEERHRTVRQIRHLLTQVLQESLHTNPQSLLKLRTAIENGLRQVEQRCRPGASSGEQDYIDYCLREISMAVELADSIVTENRHRPDLITILLDDLPIFRPCDYGVTSAESTATVSTPSITSA